MVTNANTYKKLTIFLFKSLRNFISIITFGATTKPIFLLAVAGNLKNNVQYSGFTMMEKEEIRDRINAFLTEDFEVEESSIHPDANLKETLELDSLDYIDLVVVIEQNFGFKVKPEDFQTMHTINDLYMYVENRLQVNA